MTAMRATDIVRHRRERARAAQSRGRRLGRAVAGIGLGAALVCCLALLPVVLAVSAALLNLTGGLPDIRRLEQLPLDAQASTGVTRLVALDVPAADGTRAPVLIDTINDPRATGTGWVHTAQLPPHVVTAHLAVIDPDFLSAAPPPLLDELRTWGQTGYTPAPPSSITTQLIDAHLWQDDGPGQARRAQQDWILARQIGLRYTKEQQLEWWLNTQYYGNLAYGIETAARVYFGKGATELTLGEAALLAAAAEDPTANPFDDLQAARRGQATSLSRMVTAGAITADEAAVAGAELPTLAPPPGSGSAAPDFARLARRELEAILGAERLLAGGLQVETTLDLALQKQAICVTAAARGEVPGSAGAPACPALAFAGPSSMGPDGEARTAEVIAINPASGELLALTGEPAAHSLGTLVQPFIYLTALSQGYSAATLTMDTPAIYLQDGRPYGPRNADGQYWGPLRLRQALASGRCRYVLGLRAMYNVQGVSYGTGNAEPAFGNEQFTKPFGYKIGGARFALRINRYMQRFGMKREDLYEVVALSRRHAAANPLAVWRGKEVSLEQYMDSGMVAYPHCMFDCDMPVCGASAFVMARVEDVPGSANPAFVSGLAGCHQPLEVFDMSGLKREDVGLCQLYDGFSSMVYEWLENFGWCGEGEAWKFVRDGHANADGRLPVNTFGGSIGEGRLHGIGHLREAYLQVTGRAGARQAARSDNCLVQVGPYDTGSFVMLSREAR